MTDDFDPLKALFRGEAPKADPAAKAAGIEAAMAAYDEIFSKASQGTRAKPRLMTRVRGFLSGSTKMQGLRLSHGLMAGASLAVITLIAVNSGMLRAPQNTFFIEDQPALPTEIDSKEKMAEPRQRADAQVARREIVEQLQAVPKPAPEASGALGLDLSKSESVADVIAPKGGNFTDYSEPESLAGSVMTYAPTTADQRQIYYQDQGRDRFTDIKTNPVKIAEDEPVSTFSIDVDTSSYSFVRGELNRNVLPQKDAVRVEEMINYFPYDYAGPADRTVPFKANVSVFPTPWNSDTRLMHIGIKGFSLNGQGEAQGQPGLPRRHVGLDGCARQAAALTEFAKAAGRHDGA